jgi:hypothetical protein
MYMTSATMASTTRMMIRSPIGPLYPPRGSFIPTNFRLEAVSKPGRATFAGLLGGLERPHNPVDQASTPPEVSSLGR